MGISRLLVVAAALAISIPDAAGGAESAAELMARVIAHQQTTGFKMRAKLTIQATGTDKPPVTRHIRAAGQQDARSSRVLYQAVYPQDVKGQAVIVERTNGQPIQGAFFALPGTLTPFTLAHLTQSVLASDLTAEDLAEEFQWWPNPVFGGSDKVSGDTCRVIESRPPAGVRSSYPLVRSCVSEPKLLIVRVEKVAASGQVVKRFTVLRTVRTWSGVVTARTLEVRDFERGSTTTVDISSGDRDIIVATAEFSLARLKNLGR